MLTKDKTIEQYTSELGSKLPAPGGGGASALSAVLGTSLLMMVANLTVGKKKYREHEQRISELLTFLEEKKDLFLKLCDLDEEAFLPLSAAYKLPKDTEEQRAFKASETERCLYAAAEVPLQVLREVYTTIRHADELCCIGSNLAVSDIGAGVSLLRSAGDTAYLNVIINTEFMHDRTVASRYELEAKELKQAITDVSEQLYLHVCGNILRQ